MDASFVIGLVGVILLLSAFFLNLFKFLKSDTVTYALMNIIGAGLSCYASFMIDYMPFVILEATWAVIALVGLVIILRKKG